MSAARSAQRREQRRGSTRPARRHERGGQALDRPAAARAELGHRVVRVDADPAEDLAAVAAEQRGRAAPPRREATGVDPRLVREPVLLGAGRRERVLRGAAAAARERQRAATARATASAHGDLQHRGGLGAPPSGPARRRPAARQDRVVPQRERQQRPQRAAKVLAAARRGGRAARAGRRVDEPLAAQRLLRRARRRRAGSSGPRSQAAAGATNPRLGPRGDRARQQRRGAARRTRLRLAAASSRAAGSASASDGHDGIEVRDPDLEAVRHARAVGLQQQVVGEEGPEVDVLQPRQPARRHRLGVARAVPASGSAALRRSGAEQLRRARAAPKISLKAWWRSSGPRPAPPASRRRRKSRLRRPSRAGHAARAAHQRRGARRRRAEPVRGVGRIAAEELVAAFPRQRRPSRCPARAGRASQ